MFTIGTRLISFNAPFGARCFLTKNLLSTILRDEVLMHRLALGAF